MCGWLVAVRTFFGKKLVGLEIIVYLCPRIINCTEDVYNNIIV